jgi:sulfate transport system permease protein
VVLVLGALGVLGILIVIPVAHVFYQAFRNGPAGYWQSLTGDALTLKAIRTTLTVVPIAVGLNLVFGVAAAWATARFRFRGRTLLLALIDLPFAVSPVVAGLALVLIFGAQGLIGPWLRQHDIKVLFALPGVVLATTFVTFPFVARELIPVLEAQGPEEELAALTLGAGGWQTFWRVTLPGIKYGVLYGVVLCTARAAGEFGAVYVVSGRVYGGDDTIPLRVEKLFQDYQTPASFALASLLTSLGLVTLGLKSLLEHAERKRLARMEKGGPK